MIIFLLIVIAVLTGIIIGGLAWLVRVAENMWRF